MNILIIDYSGADDVILATSNNKNNQQTEQRIINKKKFVGAWNLELLYVYGKIMLTCSL